MSQQSFATWDGDKIEGGQPAWFEQAAAEGKITRSCEGCGSHLFLEGPYGYDVVEPGETLQRDRTGVIKKISLDEALGRLRQLNLSAARGEACEESDRRSA